MLYLIEFSLLLIGLYYLAKNSKRNLLLIIAWILIVPLATMFMGQTHALRNNLMLPVFILISAYALTNISTKARIFIFSLFGIQLIYVLSTIYFFAPNKFGSFWSLEAKTASLEAINADKNQQIILSTKIDNIEYAYPVYAKIDPKLVIEQYEKWPKIYSNVIISNE